jgi:CheY-like chemotaxis protein
MKEIMKTIAIVDDNPDNVMLLEALLEEKYQTITFYSGKDALEGFRKSVPDLVLLDISMPDMSGLEVLEQMRNDKKLKHLTIIALTAHAMKTDEEKYIKAGFDCYISKPIVDDRMLFNIIDKFLK